MRLGVFLARIRLTRDSPQLIRADFAHILSISRGDHAKKKPKAIRAHAVSFEGYGHFTDFCAYGNGGLLKNRMMKFSLEVLPICRYHQPQYMLKVSAKADVSFAR